MQIHWILVWGAFAYFTNPLSVYAAEKKNLQDLPDSSAEITVGSTKLEFLDDPTDATVL